MPKVLIFNDTRDQTNWGSQACVNALIDILRKEIPNLEVETITSAKMFKGYRLRPRFLGGGPYSPRRRDKLFGRWSRDLPTTPFVADEFDWFADRWLKGEGGPLADEYVNYLKNVDAVIFNAEGSTYRMNHIAKLGLFMLWFARAHFGKPALFLNGTFALTDVDRILPAMARKAFRVLDGISVRENYSLRNVHLYVPGVAVKLIPDSVFYFRREIAQSGAGLEEINRQLNLAPYFCVSSSMLPLDFSRTRSNSALVRLIKELKGIVPQAVLTAKDDGDTWLKQVAAETGSLFFGPENHYSELMTLLQGAQFLVSGRYHNIIMSTIMGCPSIPLTTASPKIDGLCELLDGAIGTPLDVTDLWSSINTILMRAKRYLSEGESKRRELTTLSDRLYVQSLELGQMVKDCLSPKETIRFDSKKSIELEA